MKKSSPNANICPETTPVPAPPALPMPISKAINHRIGRAMHDYDMLADGDRLLVAVSGGVDSLVLAWLLDKWRQKAPITYEIMAVHIDMGLDKGTVQLVTEELAKLKIPFFIEKTSLGRDTLQAKNAKNGCFQCARKRRQRLFDLAAEHKYNKIALGHHKEDIIETFFINLMYSGNLSTMVPRQDLFAGKLALIRPLAYLEKDEIRELAASLNIQPVANPCPFADKSKRAECREFLSDLYKRMPAAKSTIFTALANVRPDYLLKSSKKNIGNHANHP